MFKVALAVYLAVAFVSACKKTDDKNTGTTVSTAGDAGKLNELFRSLRPAAQNFTVTAGNYQTITGAKGTKVTFYPNSFKDATGHIITSGTVNIQMTELYSMGSMIASRVLPVTTDGKRLRSGGEINIVATMGGQEVYANKYGLAFKQPTLSSQPMALYTGITGADSMTAWTADDTTTLGTTTGGTTIDSFGVSNSYYTFDSCTHFHWINCDHFIGTGVALTDLTVDFTDTMFNSGNTGVFVTFPSINSAGRAYGATGSHSVSCSNVPVGMNVDVVCIACVAGQYYYAHQSGITVAAGMHVTPTLAPQVFPYIQAALNAL